MAQRTRRPQPLTFRRSDFQRGLHRGTAAITAALLRMCIHGLSALPSPPNPTASWFCPTMNGTRVISPPTPDRSAAVRNEYRMSTAHAAITNPATGGRTRARPPASKPFRSAAASCRKGGGHPQEGGPNWNSPSATRFLKVHIAPPLCTRLTWARMSRLAQRWLPPVRILHPFPEARLAART